MSEEAPKFKVYLSYLKDEAPAEMVEELIAGLRAIVGEDEVFESNPNLSLSDLHNAVSECELMIHFVTAHSQSKLRCTVERRAAKVGIGYNPLAIKVNYFPFNGLLALPEILDLVRTRVNSFAQKEENDYYDQSSFFVSYEANPQRFKPLAFLQWLEQLWIRSLENSHLETAEWVLDQVAQWPDVSPDLLEQFVIFSPQASKLIASLRDADALQNQDRYFDACVFLSSAFAYAKEFGILTGLEYKLTENIREYKQCEQIHRLVEEQVRQVSSMVGSSLSSMSKAIDALKKHRDQLLECSVIDASSKSLIHVIQEMIQILSNEINHIHATSNSLFDGSDVVGSVMDWRTNPILDTPYSLVNFTLYHATRVGMQIRYSLVVYAHKPTQKSFIKHDVGKFRDELGDAPKERHSAEPIPLAPKTEITIVPEAEGITFDPPQLTKTWDEKWLRFNFDFEVPEKYPDEEVLLRVSVQVKGFEVACIKSSCEVVAETVAAAAPALPDDPLVDPPRESGTRKADAHLYRNVFLSYSHKDEEIAWRRARQIEQALGDRVFMDVKDLRAGEDWETRLFEWIDQADIIHLLWSENSAKSDYCRKEWTYALEKKCGDTRCFGVIRPVYWQKPMPDPPPELAHLHFQPIKLEEE